MNIEMHEPTRWESMKARFWSWYNRHVVAAWYRSSALWVGVLAGLVQYAPDWIEALLERWDVAGGVFDVSDRAKAVAQGVLLFVVLPIAKAWRQESMQRAQIKQAAETGKVIPLASSGVPSPAMLEQPSAQ